MQVSYKGILPVAEVWSTNECVTQAVNIVPNVSLSTLATPLPPPSYISKYLLFPSLCLYVPNV